MKVNFYTLSYDIIGRYNFSSLSDGYYTTIDGLIDDIILQHRKEVYNAISKVYSGKRGYSSIESINISTRVMHYVVNDVWNLLTDLDTN